MRRSALLLAGLLLASSAGMGLQVGEEPPASETVEAAPPPAGPDSHVPEVPLPTGPFCARNRVLTEDVNACIGSLEDAVNLVDSRCDTHTCTKVRLDDDQNEFSVLDTGPAGGKADALYWGRAKVWTEDSDGPSSGLNADFLDGLDSADFIQDVVGSPSIDAVEQPSGVVTLSLAKGGVLTIHVANGAVTEVKLSDLSVGTRKLQDGSVTTEKLLDAAVTALKLALDSVGTGHIVDEAVTTPKLADAAVTSPKLADAAVRDRHVAGDAGIAWGKVAKGGSSLADLETSSAGDLKSGTLEDARLSANVPLKDADNAFTGATTFAGSLRVDGTATLAHVDVTGSASVGGDLALAGTLSSGTVPWVRLTQFPGGCLEGQLVKAVGPALSCADDADTAYAAGSGLRLEGTEFSVDTAAIQSRVLGACAAGSSIRTIAQDGTVGCEADDDTTYAAGSGLTLAGTELSVDTTAIQARVTGACTGTGQAYVRSVAQDGTVTCGADADSGGTVTRVEAGAGLAGGPITTSGALAVATGGVTNDMLAADAVDGSKIAPGSVGAADVDTTEVQRRVTGVCAAGFAIREVLEDGTTTCEAAKTYAAGDGLRLTDTTFSVKGCASGQVLKVGVAGTWECDFVASSAGWVDDGGGNALFPAAVGRDVGLGTATPGSRLHIVGGGDVTAWSGGGFLRIGPETDGTELVFDTNELMARQNGAGAHLSLNADGGDVSVHTNSDPVTGFIVKHDGKVGLATANPTERLHVGDGSTPNAARALFDGSWVVPYASHGRALFNDQNFGIGAGMLSGGEGGSDHDLYLWSYNGAGRDIRLMSTSNGNSDPANWTTNMIVKGDTGRVGIGTTAPLNGNLVVGAGSGDLGQPSRVVADQAGVATPALTLVGENLEYAQLFVNANNDLGIQTHRAHQGQAGNILLQAGRLDGGFAGGNVGIGTTSPGARLDVNGNAEIRGNLKLTKSPDTPQSLWFNNPDLAGDWYVDAHTGRFRIHEFEPTNAERVSVLPGGNVGIGTTSPTGRLEVVGGGTAGFPLVLHGATANNGLVMFKDGAGTDRWHAKLQDGGLELVESGVAPRLHLAPGGNVGIGTANPTAKLDVSGGIRADRAKLSTQSLGSCDSSTRGTMAVLAVGSIDDLYVCLGGGGDTFAWRRVVGYA